MTETASAASGRPWLHPDWEPTAHAWIRDALRGTTARMTGAIQQSHVRPWSTVLKVPTDRGPLWFKANAPASRHESALCVLLGDVSAGHTVAPVAVDERRGWLLLPNAGEPLSPGAVADRTWFTVLGDYARLQRRLEPWTTHLLRVGVPSYLPGETPHLVQELSARLHAEEAGSQPPDIDLRLVRRWAEELDEYGVRPSLQHDDLHLGNVFTSDGRCVFIDWADASVAHPFGSLVYPVASVLQDNWPPRRISELVDTYLLHWADVADLPALRRAAALAMRLAAVGRALVWQRAVSGVQQQALKEYYARGPQRWLQRLVDGSWAVVP